MGHDPRSTIIDMTPDGSFRAPPPQAFWGLRAQGIAALAAVTGVLVLVFALALWLAITVIPVLILAGLVAIGFARLKSWRRRRFFGPLAQR